MTAPDRPPLSVERLRDYEQHAIDTILDRPYADPDDDAAIVARAAARLAAARTAVPDLLMENERLREALLLPGHRCRKIAEAAPLETGRELWLGELLEPYPGFEHETHCLHVTTPHKSVVFGVYRGDFDLLAVFGYIVGGRKPITDRWLASRAAAFEVRAALSEPQP